MIAAPRPGGGASTDPHSGASARLYVGNLPPDATSEALRDLFAAHGVVVEVHVLVDRYSGRPRGFAFVTMGSREQALEAAARMNGHLFEGRPLRVHTGETRRTG